MDKKQKLIEALKIERQSFLSRNQSTHEHDVAIEYLLTGKTNENIDDFELLEGIINDFDCFCSDYGVN